VLQLGYEDFINIAKAFNFVSSVSQKPGNKIKFNRWNLTYPPSINNLVLLTKSESNKHLEAKNSNDLLRIYGEETYNRICNTLRSLKSEI
jgi:hypothetical protein